MSVNKRLFRYLLPILALPMLSGIGGFLTQTLLGPYGTVMVAADAAFRSAVSWLDSVLMLLALATLVPAAILAETGRLKAGKTFHIVGFIVFAAVYALNMLVFFLLPDAMLRIYAMDPEVISIGRIQLEAFALAAVLLPSAACLIAQLVRRYSMILTLCLCGGIQLLVLLIGVVLLAQWGGHASAGAVVGLMNGVSFSVLRVIPFMMVPIAGFCRQFDAPASLAD